MREFLVVTSLMFVSLQCPPTRYTTIVSATSLPPDSVLYYNNNNNVVRALRSRDFETPARTSWSRDSSPVLHADQLMQKLGARDLTPDSAAFTRQSKSAVGAEHSKSILFAAAAWPLLDNIEQSRINDVISDTIFAKYQPQMVAETVLDGTSDGVDGWSSEPHKAAAKTWRSTSINDDYLSQPAVRHINTAHTPLVQTSKRTFGQLRTPRELHPVYLGLGQSAASAALNTYASLLADDKRRESLEQQATGNPVRFIGRR